MTWFSAALLQGVPGGFSGVKNIKYNQEPSGDDHLTNQDLLAVNREKKKRETRRANRMREERGLNKKEPAKRGGRLGSVVSKRNHHKKGLDIPRPYSGTKSREKGLSTGRSERVSARRDEKSNSLP